ncbi:MAG: polysaccharide deacetylase [Deltaproteobacteria bacterium]|nr:MAG: polysaccharide deacetylase [Deltaproteobacteria bacterium]
MSVREAAPAAWADAPAEGGALSTRTGRVGNVSVDLDSLVHYHRIHGLAAPGDVGTIYAVAVPRLLSLLDDLDIRATLFVVAGELERPVARDALVRARDAGHEIASHSFRHAYDMREWSERSIAQDLDRADRAIERWLGVRPVGFRAPGYNVDIGILRLLAERGYRYDSSVFPCPSYYAAKAGVLAWMGLRGRDSVSMMTDPRALLAPTQPYRPSRFALHRRGDRKHSLPLWELPIGVTPVTRLPLIGTSLLGLPSRVLDALPGRLARRAPFFGLELHAIDLMDRHDPGISPALVRHQPDLRRRWTRKADALRTLLTAMERHYRLEPLVRVVEALDALEGPPVIGTVDSPYFDLR